MTLQTKDVRVLDYSVAGPRDWVAGTRRVCTWTIGIALISGLVLLLAHLVRQTTEIARERDAFAQSVLTGGAEALRLDFPFHNPELPAAATKSPALERLLNRHRAPQDHYGTVLASQLTSPGGTDAFVWVRSVTRDASCIVIGSTPSIHATVVRPTSLLSRRVSADPLVGGRADLESVDRAKRVITVYTATPDPHDASHASFILKIDAEEVCYDLWLRDDDSTPAGLTVAVEKRREASDTSGVRPGTD
ncbi:MAG TPA: hypothetical protein PLD59_03665 [Tepidisphaeraceae bacterium]|nr:hypothetical protein [Tepidisphaeraceae bacterium]